MDDNVVGLLSSFLGHHKKHDSDSGQISFDCPACSEEKGLPDGDGKGNLEINYKKNLFNCWACGEDRHMKGSIHYLVRRYAPHGIMTMFNQIYDVSEYKFHANENQPEKILTIPTGLISLNDNNDKSWVMRNAKMYLNKRGVTREMIERHRLSLCTDPKYKGRIFFPSYNKSDKLNYYTTRTSHNKTKLKYINSDVDKTGIIFNERLINTNATIHIVEGPFDHIVVPNSIPTLGKIMYDKLYYFLQNTENIDIVVMYDGDAFKSTLRVAHELNSGNLSGRIRVIKLPTKYDPSKINELYGQKGIFKVLSTSYKPKLLYV